MHIAIDARAINSTTGTVLRMLLPRLQELDRDNRYTVIVKTKDRHVWTPTAPNFAVRTLAAEDYSMAVQTRLLALLRELKADLVYFFMPEQPVLYSGRRVTNFFDLTMLKTPEAGAKRRLRSYLKLPLARLVFRVAALRSDRVMTSAEYTKRELISRYRLPADRVEVIHCGADVAPGETLPVAHPFARFLLYVGQHGWHKNLARLCDAHQALLERHPELGLILAGKIDRQARVTQAYVEERGYRNILFTGFLPDAQRDWLYREAAAYVFPSLMEGFGLPGVEAMGFGTPVVSSNATCLPEIYGDAAHYFDPRDTNDMVRSIDEILTSEGLRLSLAARGKERYQRYCYDRMARELLALLHAAG